MKSIIKILPIIALALPLTTIAMEDKTPHPVNNEIGKVAIFNILEGNTYAFGEKIMTLDMIKKIATTPLELAETHKHTLESYKINPNVFLTLQEKEQWDIVLIMKAELSDPNSTRYFKLSEVALNRKKALVNQYFGLIVG